MRRTIAVLGAAALAWSGCAAQIDAPVVDASAAATDLAMPDVGIRDPLPVVDLATPDLATPDLATPDLAVADLATPDLSLVDLAPVEVPGRLRAYAASDAVHLDPERGFYRFVEITSETDLRWVRLGTPPATLVFSYVRLDAWRNGPIAPAHLDAMERGLDAARAAGLKVILRFAYNDGPWPNPDPDAPLAIVLAHIAQLAPYLARHADAIPIVQAGFIGAWGEWHTSTNGLDQLAPMRAILEALVDALPPETLTQVRYPLAKMALYGGAPLDAMSAFGPGYRARVGHHNDCWLSSDDDVGTYWIDTMKYPPNLYPYTPADLERFVEAETAWVPFGGETCAVYATKQDCPAALGEAARKHLGYLNYDWLPRVLQGWQQQGCLGELERRMGYRLRLVDAELPDAAPAGARLRVKARLRNEGFAAPWRARPVVVVVDGARRIEAPIAIDLRRVLAGTEALVEAPIDLPRDLPPGRYRVALWLPDPAPRLRARADYAIRLAAMGTWDAASGLDVLGTLDVTAPGP